MSTKEASLVGDMCSQEVEEVIPLEPIVGPQPTIPIQLATVSLPIPPLVVLTIVLVPLVVKDAEIDA